MAVWCDQFLEINLKDLFNDIHQESNPLVNDIPDETNLFPTDILKEIGLFSNAIFYSIIRALDNFAHAVNDSHRNVADFLDDFSNEVEEAFASDEVHIFSIKTVSLKSFKQIRADVDFVKVVRKPRCSIAILSDLGCNTPNYLSNSFFCGVCLRPVSNADVKGLVTTIPLPPPHPTHPSLC